MELLAMPPEIAGSVNNVCRGIKKAIHDHVNKHGGYNYTSYDRFLEDTGPLLADNGLFIVMNEHEAVTDGKWLSITFHIYLYHSSGKHFGPIVRTQAVMANGPQAYAACQSFVEKYFMRQLFKIPTGEGEIDADTQSNKTPIPASKGKPKLAQPFNESESIETADHMIAAINACKANNDLIKWAGTAAEDRARLAIQDNARVMKAYKEAEAKLEKDIFE